MATFTGLSALWFAVIGLLWAGYFFLEGFDFGVGMVSPLVSRDDTDRRLCMNAVGPVWDGNEVWLLVAGGATFAAFPRWYGLLFQGAYLALFLVLMALIVRGVSFEFRGKLDSPGWRRTWDVANFAGSLVAALVWGVAFTNFVHGLPVSAAGYTGGLIGLLNPPALVGGLAALAVFAFHGSLFLSLKTSGELMQRARRVARPLGGAAAVLLAVTVAWAAAAGRPWQALSGAVPAGVPLALGVLAVASLAVALLLVTRGRDGFAFAGTGAAILLSMGAVFAVMFPAVIPASNGAALSLTVGAAASHPYTLVVMTIVAAIFTPLVLLYQGWTYWVFRQRLQRPIAAATAEPAAGGR
ncbi:MAG: cytochrome d ubiquinol oxidase subunit II [Candidatus Dormibacteria bacterium]|jgi:cytochrome d ubiquinol oxidase subunit II